MLFTDLLADLARERRAVLDALASVDASTRTTRPSPDAWSPLEIAEHVFKVERANLTGLERQLERGDDRRDLGAPSRTKTAALIFSMRSPQRFHAPDVPLLAIEGMPYEALRDAWTALGPRWENALAALPPELTEIALVKHPFAGPLTPRNLLRFLVAHTARHRGQLERAVGASA